jgi:hypothetical protein
MSQKAGDRSVCCRRTWLRKRTSAPVVGVDDGSVTAGTRAGSGQRRNWKDAVGQRVVFEIAGLLGSDRRQPGDEHQLVGRRKLHHLAGGQQWSRRVLPRNHQVTEPRREPVAGIVLHGAHFRRRAQGIGDAARGAFIVGREGDPDVAVVEDRVVRAVGFLDLIERLRDQKGF